MIKTAMRLLFRFANLHFLAGPRVAYLREDIEEKHCCRQKKESPK